MSWERFTEMSLIEAAALWTLMAILVYLAVGLVVIAVAHCIGGYCGRRMERLERNIKKAEKKMREGCRVYKFQNHKRGDEPQDTAGDSEPQ